MRGKEIEWERPNRGGGRHVHFGILKDVDTLAGRVGLRDGPNSAAGFHSTYTHFSAQADPATH
jgi:hypothetical protein